KPRASRDSPGSAAADSQREAVEACLRERIHFVWGPPGTGKTTTLGLLVAELVSEGCSVLVTAHANVAVDAAVLATLKHLEGRGRGGGCAGGQPPPIVRAGPAALKEVRDREVSSRDWVLRAHPELAKRLRELEAQLAELPTPRTRNTKRFREAVDELKRIRTELRERERVVVNHARILFATLPKVAIESAIYERGIEPDLGPFDAVIVDEASMAYAAQIVFAASLAEKRLAVFGDFRQLPPIVISKSPATREVLERDVFALAGIVDAVDRGSTPAELSMLRVQYRMHPEIRQLVSGFAYLDRLRDGPGVVERTAQIAALPPGEGRSVVVVETDGMGARGWYAGADRSRWNPLSGFWAFRFAHDLACRRLTVALLAPYRPQAAL
ncbi:MAG: hypothetical protein C4344_03035, partial [Acidimicrobiia bacterium]